MAHRFSVRIQGDPQRAVQNVETQLRAAGGTFAGDARAGKFGGKSPVGLIEGTYEVHNDTVTVTITKKPFVVPNSTVEGKIREYFASV